MLLFLWLKRRELTSDSPFESRPTNALAILSTVVIANGLVNCDSAHSVGINSHEDMIGKTFADVKLHRGEEVVVHPQHMLTGSLSTPDSATDLATYMKYELAPPSIKKNRISSTDKNRTRPNWTEQDQNTKKPNSKSTEKKNNPPPPPKNKRKLTTKTTTTEDLFSAVHT